MSSKKIYSIIGIGIGPFNMGLAALLEPVKQIDCLFFDQKPEFDWHSGLMFNNSTLQTPFLCDGVSMADPTSKFSFLNYLKLHGKLYKFFIKESFYILRKEYNNYCKWVTKSLKSCLFSRRVESINYLDGIYEITVHNLSNKKIEKYYSKKIVLGTGTQPSMPSFVSDLDTNNIIHTSKYLNCRNEILNKDNITIIGSGQSAAEVFFDILQKRNNNQQINWMTRANRFYPMEYSKLTLELTSPDYVDYFFNINSQSKEKIIKEQLPQFKGINYDLINDIYDYIYMLNVDEEDLKLRIQPNCTLDKIQINGSKLTLEFNQVEQNKEFTLSTDFVIMGTGYKYSEPHFIKNIEHRINRNKKGKFKVKRNYSIGKDDDIFVLNAETHTHSLISTDLGMGAYRSSVIINELVGEQIYKVEQRIAFQDFGV